MIVRVIRMYVSKRVKILLLALIVALLDVLKHDLTKFLHYSCFICIYRERMIGLRKYLVSGIDTPVPPLQSSPLPNLRDGTREVIIYGISAGSKGKSATGIVVFLVGGRELLSAAAVGKGWVGRLVSR